MKKQFVFGVITVMLLLILFGCNMEHVDPGTTDSPTVTTLETGIVPTTIPNETTKATVPANTHRDIIFEPDPPVSDEEMKIAVQYLPETVENPDNVTVLKWLCLMASTSWPWTEDAVHELNQTLADRNVPFRIQFIMVTSDQSYLYTDWFSRPEVQELLPDVDLIYGSMTAEDRKEYLLPITEYVTGNAQPTLKNAVVHELSWIGGTTDGEIYGIPTWPMQGLSNGWAVDPEILTNNGLTAEDFKKNFWEMDELFAKIYKQNGNTPFLFLDADGYADIERTSVDLNTVLPSAIADLIGNSYDFIGAYFSVDYSADVPTVVNTLDTDYVRNVWAAIMRYKDAGYVVKNTRQTPPQMYFNQTWGEKVYTYNDFLCIPVTPVTFISGYSDHNISGVASTSQHVEEAVTLLNMVAEDEAFQTQLFWGKEGRDYTFDEDGGYSNIRYEDMAYYSMKFLSAHSFFNKIAEKENDWMLITHDGKTKLQTYLDNLDSVQFCEYPIIFDYSGFEDELDAIAEICNTYYFFYTNDTEIGNSGNLDYKPRMTEELYDQMLQELKDAGSEKIQAELQRQLDEWLAENPDWQN